MWLPSPHPSVSAEMSSPYLQKTTFSPHLCSFSVVPAKALTRGQCCKSSHDGPRATTTPGLLTLLQSLYSSHLPSFSRWHIPNFFLPLHKLSIISPDLCKSFRFHLKWQLPPHSPPTQLKAIIWTLSHRPVLLLCPALSGHVRIICLLTGI